MPSMTLTHNMEIAHRLTLLPGKCQQIHGHSMIVKLTVYGDFGENGYMVSYDGEPLDFGTVKKEFRTYLDDEYDHHLLLNDVDPWAQPLAPSAKDFHPHGVEFATLPGLTKLPGDPSTENLTHWIASRMAKVLNADVEVEIQETGTNAVKAGASAE